MSGPSLRRFDWKARKRPVIGLLLIVTLIAAGTAFLIGRSSRKNAGVGQTFKSRERDVPYVDSRVCAQCHQKQYAQWSGSHHDRAMQDANEETVLGDFGDTSFTHFSATSRFFKQAGKFFINTEGPDGKPSEFEVKFTFGVEPLQQYLIEFPGGRMQGLTIAWDTENKRWFHLYTEERIDHDDPLHWTGRYQNWNFMCADCHSTNLRKGYEPQSDTYQTTWAEMNVSCQACHGPADSHVAWAHALEDSGIPPHGDNGLLTDFKSNDSRFEVDACAPCHSRRIRINSDDWHGRPFMDTFAPELLRDELYFSDGQILDEVYVYGSFIQSKMYLAGVRCTDCHNPHSLKLRRDGNAVCVQCHQEQPVERFAGLTLKNYDSPDHHFHESGSEGAQCVSCHMPTRTYMVLDPRQDHSLRVPRPDLSVKLGVPNACSMCHQDKSMRWAADVAAEWHGPLGRKDQHYAEAIALGREGSAQAEVLLIGLVKDSHQPSIFRATSLELLRRYGPEGIECMIWATGDEDPLVRATAVGGLERLPPKQRLTSVAPLLKDPIRAVRIEAARVLASVPAALFVGGQRDVFSEVLAEYEQAQVLSSDMPQARMNLGLMYANMGRSDLAEQSYQTAIRMDRNFLPARVNLAILYNTTGRNEDAEHVLREAIERAPSEGELYYSLGLLMAEEDRLEEAVNSLARAVELLPARARVHYNHALALQHLGRETMAEAAMLKASHIDPTDPGIVHAIAVMYIQQGRWKEALAYARKLAELAPGAPAGRQLIQQIRQALSFEEAPRK